MFSQNEMKADGTQKYEIECFLANGTFGHVFKATEKDSGSKVAWKRVPKVTKRMSREVEVLETVKGCDHVVPLLDVFYTLNCDNRLIQNLIFPLFDCDLELILKNRMRTGVQIPYMEAKKMICQVARGLAAIHEVGVCHRDLKPENVLQRDGTAYITDFGSSKILNRHNTPYAVSRYYRSPELLFGLTDYNCSVDVWSLGVIAYEFILGGLPFKGKTEGQQLIEISRFIGFSNNSYFNKIKSKMTQFDTKFELFFKFPRNKKFEKDISKLEVCQTGKKRLGKFLIDCFEIDYENRMTGVAAASHEFFKEFANDKATFSVKTELVKQSKEKGRIVRE